MPNNLNSYLVTVKLPCTHCEGRGEIVHPLHSAYQDLIKDQPSGRTQEPVWGVFARSAGADPSQVPHTMTCPKCAGEKWAVTDIPITALAAGELRDSVLALARELDTQVGAIGKTLEEQKERHDWAADHVGLIANTLEAEQRLIDAVQIRCDRMDKELVDRITDLRETDLALENRIVNMEHEFKLARMGMKTLFEAVTRMSTNRRPTKTAPRAKKKTTRKERHAARNPQG